MKTPLYIFAFLILLLSSIFFLNKDNSIDIENKNPVAIQEIIKGDDIIADNDSEFEKSPYIGVPCENSDRRPIAVMMANDAIVRPLSGISSADIIVEMPVVTGGITRIMALFSCDMPSEVGALRSARHDFTPLSMGFDSIFVHWGGSHFALDELNGGITDNINALINPFSVFYRKSGIPAPHNGFSSYDSLWLATKKLGYRQETVFDSYEFEEKDGCDVCEDGILRISYGKPYDVSYSYDKVRNSYLRFRNGFSETDKLNNYQVEVKNVVVARAFSRQIEGQYNDVDIEGSGDMILYKNGTEVGGTWKKGGEDKTSPFLFFDESGEKIEFTPGKIIIEVVELEQSIKYIR